MQANVFGPESFEYQGPPTSGLEGAEDQIESDGKMRFKSYLYGWPRISAPTENPPNYVLLTALWRFFSTYALNWGER